MSAPVEIKVGRCYRCKDGVDRWVVMLHKFGRGRSVTWDTVDPLQPDYWRSELGSRIQRTKMGLAGLWAFKMFEHMALAEIDANRGQSR